VLWINGTLIVPAGFPNTHKKLAALGLPMVTLDVSEARLMDGGLTCMSLRF
jgi:dimethylargininase